MTSWYRWTNKNCSLTFTLSQSQQLDPIRSDSPNLRIWPRFFQGIAQGLFFSFTLQPWNVPKSPHWQRLLRQRAKPTPFRWEQTGSCAPPAYASCQSCGAAAARRAGKCHCSARRPERRCHPLYRSLFALSWQRRFITAGYASSAPSAKPPPTKQLFHGMDARSLARSLRFCRLRRASVFFARPLCALILWFEVVRKPLSVSVNVFVSSLDSRRFSLRRLCPFVLFSSGFRTPFYSRREFKSNRPGI